MTVTLPSTITESQAVQNAGTAVDSVQRLISQQADQLGQTAAQLGRAAVEQSSATAKDATATASTAAQQALRSAAQSGRGWLQIGRQSVRDLGRDLRTMGSDLRQYRLTNEPVRTGPDPAPRIAIVGALAAGLGLMYFLDPDQGRRRRAQLREKLSRWTRIGGQRAAGTAKHLQNRAVGAVHETRSALVGVMGQDAANENTNGAAPHTQPYAIEPTTEPAEVGL